MIKMPLPVLELALKAKQEILLSQKKDVWESARVGWFYFLNSKVKRKFKKLTDLVKFAWENETSRKDALKKIYEKYKEEGLIK